MPLTRRIDVSATWEIELLISGLVLIGLLQLPALLDRFFDPRLPHAIGGMRSVLFALQLYLKAAAFALIASFVVHLVARGYWVGLIGLNSVFPRGPRWDQLRYGPVAIAYYRRRFQSLPDRIAKVDDFCSVAFPFAFLVVFMVIVSLALGGVLAIITYAVSRYLLGGRSGDTAFLVIAGTVTAVPLTIAAVDRKLGARIPPASMAGRALRAGVRAMAAMTMMPVVAPIMLTLFSNIRKRLIYPVFYLAFLGVIAASVVSVFVRKGELQMNGYDYFGPSPAHGVDARFYESLRPEDRAYDAVPLIQGDLRFYEHPRFGLRGVVTYIATDSLPKGRNEIRVAAIPVADSLPLPPFVIPFWR